MSAITVGAKRPREGGQVAVADGVADFEAAFRWTAHPAVGALQEGATLDAFASPPDTGRRLGGSPRSAISAVANEVIVWLYHFVDTLLCFVQ